jgi:hypothetical protein
MVGSYVSTKWFRHSCHKSVGSQSHAQGRLYLYSQGRLAHAAVAQHHQLVQRHFPRHGVGVAGDAMRKWRGCRRRSGAEGWRLLKHATHVRPSRDAWCKPGATSSQDSYRAGSLAADQQAQLTCRAGQLQRGGFQEGRCGSTDWWFQTCRTQRARQHRLRVLRLAAGTSESIGRRRAQCCTSKRSRRAVGQCCAVLCGATATTAGVAEASGGVEGPSAPSGENGDREGERERQRGWKAAVETEDEQQQQQQRAAARATTRRGQRSVCKAKSPRAARLVSPRERGQGWVQSTCRRGPLAGYYRLPGSVSTTSIRTRLHRRGRRGMARLRRGRAR